MPLFYLTLTVFGSTLRAHCVGVNKLLFGIIYIQATQWYRNWNRRIDGWGFQNNFGFYYCVQFWVRVANVTNEHFRFCWQFHGSINNVFLRWNESAAPPLTNESNFCNRWYVFLEHALFGKINETAKKIVTITKSGIMAWNNRWIKRNVFDLNRKSAFVAP